VRRRRRHHPDPATAIPDARARPSDLRRGVEGQRAVLARTADLLELAGAVSVPASKRGTPWDEVRRQVRAARARARR
jgi:hypothetical protein